jgi:hypothetical protein
MSEIRSEFSEMSSVTEASALVRHVAEPRQASDSVKAAINRAARCLGWSHSRTKDIWYGDARRIDAAEMDRLREVAARAEADLAISRIVALRESLTATDADFHRETIDLLGAALERMGRSVDAKG